MGDMPKFEELPLRVRKSSRHRWNYLRELLSDVENPEPEPEESPKEDDS